MWDFSVIVVATSPCTRHFMRAPWARLCPSLCAQMPVLVQCGSRHVCRAGWRHQRADSGWGVVLLNDGQPMSPCPVKSWKLSEVQELAVSLATMWGID